MIVSAGGEKFAIPQLSVVELVRTGGNSEHKIENVNKTPVLRLRDRLLPLVSLTSELGIQPVVLEDDEGAPQESQLQIKDSEESYLVVAQVGAQTFGVVVDEVFDTEEIVVKPVSTILREITMFSGNTILGDGSIIMIIDPNGMAAAISKEQIEQSTDAADMAVEGNIVTENETTSLLIFRAGTPEPKAVPLSVVTRLEEIQVDQIETSGGETLVQYRGTLMPLVHGALGTQLKTDGRQPTLVFSDGGRMVGIAVDEICDVFDDRLDVQHKNTHPGMLGTAVVDGHATEVLDVGYYLTQVHADWFERRPDEGEQVRHSVLLVDDSAFFRNMMAPLLKVAGYQVTVAESVEQAWSLRETGAKFDVIVSDIEMPDTDGWAFAEKIRGDSEWGTTPVVALSSRNDPADLARSHDVGFVDHISKTDRDRIVSVLESTLSKKEEAA